MSNLQPCPFCGGRAIFEQAKSAPCQLHGERETFWRIVCRHQQTNFMPETNAKLPVCHICPTITAGTKERATEIWNTRADQWQPIETAPKEGAFLAWCRWHMVPSYKSGLSTQPQPYWTDWMARHCWMGHQGLVYAEGNELYRVHEVEATHWMPLPTPPL